MNNQLSNYQSNPLVAAPTTMPSPTQQATTEVVWESIELDTHRFADVFQTGLSGEVIAWSGGRHRGVTVKRSGALVQVRTLWAAVSHGFDVWVVERVLKKTRSGFQPASPWNVKKHDQHQFAPGVMRRSGKVRSRVSTSKVTANESSTPVGGEMVNGLEKLSYLPVKVQRGILALVPNPHLVVGHLINPADSDRMVIDLLVFNGRQAVIIHASARRGAANPTWEVTQLSGTVTNPTAAVTRGATLSIGDK